MHQKKLWNFSKIDEKTYHFQQFPATAPFIWAYKLHILTKSLAMIDDVVILWPEVVSRCLFSKEKKYFPLQIRLRCMVFMEKKCNSCGLSFLVAFVLCAKFLLRHYIVVHSVLHVLCLEKYGFAFGVVIWNDSKQWCIEFCAA